MIQQLQRQQPIGLNNHILPNYKASPHQRGSPHGPLIRRPKAEVEIATKNETFDV